SAACFSPPDRSGMLTAYSEPATRPADPAATADHVTAARRRLFLALMGSSKSDMPIYGWRYAAPGRGVQGPRERQVRGLAAAAVSIASGSCGFMWDARCGRIRRG